MVLLSTHSSVTSMGASVPVPSPAATVPPIVVGPDPDVGIGDSPAAGHDPRHDAHQDLLHDQWSPRVAQTDALVPVGERADDVLVHEASVENVVPRPALVVADDFRLQELQLTWEVVVLVLQGESLRATGDAV